MAASGHDSAWTQREELQFLRGMNADWKDFAATQARVKTKTVSQVIAHYYDTKHIRKRARRRARGKAVPQGPKAMTIQSPRSDGESTDESEPAAHETPSTSVAADRVANSSASDTATTEGGSAVREMGEGGEAVHDSEGLTASAVRRRSRRIPNRQQTQTTALPGGVDRGLMGQDGHVWCASCHHRRAEVLLCARFLRCGSTLCRACHRSQRKLFMRRQGYARFRLDEVNPFWLCLQCFPPDDSEMQPQTLVDESPLTPLRILANGSASTPGNASKANPADPQQKAGQQQRQQRRNRSALQLLSSTPRSLGRSTPAKRTARAVTPRGRASAAPLPRLGSTHSPRSPATGRHLSASTPGRYRPKRKAAALASFLHAVSPALPASEFVEALGQQRAAKRLIVESSDGSPTTATRGTDAESPSNVRRTPRQRRRTAKSAASSPIPDVDSEAGASDVSQEDTAPPTDEVERRKSVADQVWIRELPPPRPIERMCAHSRMQELIAQRKALRFAMQFMHRYAMA